MAVLAAIALNGAGSYIIDLGGFLKRAASPLMKGGPESMYGVISCSRSWWI